MNRLYLCPFDGIGPALVQELQASLSFLLDPLSLPAGPAAALEPFYSYERSQYNSTLLLASLRLRRPPGADGVSPLLAVVSQDLFIPPLTFVFGEAELGGVNAVVSTYRLENERYGLPTDTSLLAERLVKESLHEIGHLGGLTHCFEQRCVMRVSTSVEEIDLKDRFYCEACRDSLSSTIGRPVPAGPLPG